MKVLSVESSSVVAGAAIVSDDKIIYEGFLNFKKNHSCVLMPMVEAAFEASGFGLKDIDVFAVTSGPGSFTGLRIGIATVKGLSAASGKPIAPIPTLDALAYNIPVDIIKCQTSSQSAIVCPILDARRDQVYTSIYNWQNNGYIRLGDYMALPVTELAEILICYNEPVVFVGDGIPVYKDFLRAKMQDRALFAPPHLMYQRPSVIALLGAKYFRDGLCVDSAQLQPFYLRKSQAEQKAGQG